MRVISLQLLASLVAWLGVAGCESAPARPADEPVYQVACEDPRPEVCTKEYRPVCGLRDTGIRCVTTPCDSEEWRTYGNACTACSDADVYGYDAGACAEGVAE